VTFKIISRHALRHLETEWFGKLTFFLNHISLLHCELKTYLFRKSYPPP